MRHGSLFSGIGGFDLASEWMGWENIFHCEWNEFGKKVLHHYWPNAESFDDITKTDFTKYANQIDILTGGFPCQPFSTAGKRKGTDDERYLWGEMLRAIQEIKPRFVIAENVFGITNIDGGLVFEQVCLDLETEGYEVQPFIIPAAAKNAPHRRDRCWFIAQNPVFSRCLHGEFKQKGTTIWEFGDIGTRSADGIYLSKGDATNTNGNGFDKCNIENEINTSQRRVNAFSNIESGDVYGITTNANSSSKGSPRTSGETESKRGNGHLFTEQWGESSELDNRLHKFSRDVTNTTSTRGGENNGQGESRFNDQKSSPNNWDNFPTESPICGGDDGLPTELDGITFPKWRNESIKAYGNAIVPQVAYEIFKAIERTI